MLLDVGGGKGATAAFFSLVLFGVVVCILLTVMDVSNDDGLLLMHLHLCLPWQLLGG